MDERRLLAPQAAPSGHARIPLHGDMANTTQNIMADKILFMGWPLPHCLLLSATINENQ